MPLRLIQPHVLAKAVAGLASAATFAVVGQHWVIDVVTWAEAHPGKVALITTAFTFVSKRVRAAVGRIAWAIARVLLELDAEAEAVRLEAEKRADVERDAKQAELAELRDRLEAETAAHAETRLTLIEVETQLSIVKKERP